MNFSMFNLDLDYSAAGMGVDRPLRDFEKPGPLPFCGECKACDGSYKCNKGEVPPRTPAKKYKNITYPWTADGLKWRVSFPKAQKEAVSIDGKPIHKGERYEYRIRKTTLKGIGTFISQRRRLEDSEAWRTIEKIGGMR